MCQSFKNWETRKCQDKKIQWVSKPSSGGGNENVAEDFYFFLVFPM